MPKYLEEIESAYSRGRGKMSLLKPADWQLAQEWETEGVPLNIALAAIDEGFESHKKANSFGQINTLRYFEKIVDKKFGAWLTAQIGKSETSTAALAVADETDIIAYFAGHYAERKDLPEPLQSAVTELTRDLNDLYDEAANNPAMTATEIEERLSAMATGLEMPMALAVPEKERAEIAQSVDREFRNLTDEIRTKVCIKRLYKKFNLPTLSVFE